jgi:rSAM/selenodomain-associated transferase 2
MKPLRISIIVPVWREQRIIADFLGHLRVCTPEAELIVVDGGSDDDTTRQARGNCDRLIVSSRGRAQQMNGGAAIATGDVLWFLHADCRVSKGCLDAMRNALRDPLVIGGYFRIHLPSHRLVYRLTDDLAHYAGRLLRMRFGDHGLFCRRAEFQTLGGFPEVPIMEDAEFFRAMHGLGRVVGLPQRLTLSTRRFEQVGPTKLTMAYALIAALYAIGVPLPSLHKLYRRTCAKP